MQLAKDGRRILWLAHESAPKNYTAVDVTDPQRAEDRRPRATCRNRTCAPIRWRRSATSWRSPTRRSDRDCSPPGSSCSTSRPRKTRSGSAFFDCSGPDSRGVHQLWFADGETIHMSSGAADFRPTAPERRPVLPCDRRAQPVEAGRDRPLVAARARRSGDNVAPPKRHPGASSTPASARTTPTSIPERPDRVYMGYIDGGMIILDIADKAHPKMVVALGLPPAQRRLHPYRRAVLRPQPPGRQRRVHPQRRRRLAEAGVDRRQPHRGEPGADRDLPVAAGRDLFAPRRPVRRAQSVGEPAEGRLLEVGQDRLRHVLQRRAAGLRHSRTRTSRRRSRYFVPQVENAPTGACQINDVFVDDRGIVFCRRPPRRRALCAGNGFLSRAAAMRPSRRVRRPLLRMR